MSRTKILAILGGLGVAGLVAASAAQLTVNADDLGAGVDEVVSCDTNGVRVEFTGIGYNGDIGTFGGAQVTEVTISGIAAACNGEELALTLAETVDNEAIYTWVDIPVDGSGTVEVDTSFENDGTTPFVVDASEVTRAAVVIAGLPV